MLAQSGCAAHPITIPPLRLHVRRAAAAGGDGVCLRKGGLAVQLVEQLAPPRITKSDEAFAADGLEFVYSYEGIDLEELNDLFGKVHGAQSAGRHTATALHARITARSECRIRDRQRRRWRIMRKQVYVASNAHKIWCAERLICS